MAPANRNLKSAIGVASNTIFWARSLDRVVVHDRVSDMKVSSRSLVRDFPKAKAAARKGQAVEIVDGKTRESVSF